MTDLLAHWCADCLACLFAGKEVDPLIAAGSFELAAADVAARLAAGERVMVPLQLAEPAAGKQQLLPGGLGGQVCLTASSHVLSCKSISTKQQPAVQILVVE